MQPSPSTRRSLEIKPQNATVHRNLGLALASAGQPDEAAAEYRKALKIDPNEAVAHGALGMALAGLGRLDEAVAEYRKALKINPNDAIAYNKLAWIRATHPDPRFRDGAEAVTLARRPSRSRLVIPRRWARWPPPTPRRAGFPRPLPRPAMPWNLQGGKTTPSWPLRCKGNWRFIGPASRFVSHCPRLAAARRRR